MVSAQILRRNQQLEEEAKQFADLCRNLTSEIEKLTLEQVETDDMIFDIYTLLCSEVTKENNILHMRAGSENMGDVLDNIRVSTKDLLYGNDFSKKENEALKKIIHDRG